jgi:hypothetical protein
MKLTKEQIENRRRSYVQQKRLETRNYSYDITTSEFMNIHNYQAFDMDEIKLHKVTEYSNPCYNIDNNYSSSSSSYDSYSDSSSSCSSD